ncbi:MAG: hypothetical protein IKM04_04380 [Clostridia bacterium]|nr:hypothetical protein [Clostridia bacterium]
MKKAENKWYIAIIIAFFLPMLAFFVISVSDTDAVRSESENRQLADFPDITVRSLLNGDFSADFEAYYSDTFPYREQMLSASKLINRFYYVTFRSEGTTVIVPGGPGNTIGDGETLPSDAFDNGTTEAPPVTDQSTTPPVTDQSSSSSQDTTRDQTTQGTTLPETSETTSTTPPATVMRPSSWVPVTSASVASGGKADHDGSSQSGLIIYNGAVMERYYMSKNGLTRYGETLNSLKTLLPEVNVFAMVVPKAIEYKAPSSYSSGSCSALNAMNAAYSALVDVIPVDVWSALDAHRDEYIYFRTDHHWTQLGAYYAYRALAEVGGFYANELESYQSGTYNKFIGSLFPYVKNIPQGAALADNPDSLTYYLPLTGATARIYYDQAMSGSGTAINLITTNIKDSFSNKYLCFLQGDQPLIHVTNPNIESERKLIVLKESYGNAIVPFLSDHFSDIFVIDPRKWNGEGEKSFDLIEFAKANGVTDILCVSSLNSAQVFGSGYYMNDFTNLLP